MCIRTFTGNSCPRCDHGDRKDRLQWGGGTFLTTTKRGSTRSNNLNTSLRSSWKVVIKLIPHHQSIMSTLIDNHDSDSNDQSILNHDHNDHHDLDDSVHEHSNDNVNLADQTTLEQGYRQDGNDPHSSGNQLLEQAFPNLQEPNLNPESIDEYPVDTEIVEVEQTGPVDDVQDDQSSHPVGVEESQTTLERNDGLGTDHPMADESPDLPIKSFAGKASRLRTRKRPAEVMSGEVEIPPIASSVAGPSSSAVQRSHPPLQSQDPSISVPTTYSNKEQLAILRQFYLENPTPSKSEIVELARATGRPWGKVKEYFRQRRNKLRGVDEAGLDGMDEPDRATSWWVRFPLVVQKLTLKLTIEVNVQAANVISSSPSQLDLPIRPLPGLPIPV
jgi:hypothetical protein